MFGRVGLAFTPTVEDDFLEKPHRDVAAEAAEDRESRVDGQGDEDQGDKGQGDDE